MINAILLVSLLTTTVSAQELVLLNNVVNVGGANIRAIFKDAVTDCNYTAIVRGFEVDLTNMSCKNSDGGLEGEEVDIQFSTESFPMRAGEKFQIPDDGE
ncbi:hypothetical protein AB4455_07290 [Vibrio sp. 10N.261.46.E12]|uniref:hypothetical protein n=1 Tax=unclassified Vibrio TaxID=2614977 RepID=UPI00097826E8|nr:MULTISPECIES: hypothetical protein [unclassified Vibrio]OMO36472.1 hypothetical protein BH584_04090 [Vibrio sp. 10N.261.45.E1]PMJ22138.1 hypothetical protein BCU27_17130 [Vibrio sp. 10N.286.45.B6]PML97418.1 hypothetical protein BCT66_21070 [Vibrio sp. 10N.261.49.E11]PMM76550.1 hypothetical protein BCT48_01925 [Vibrio sp. 10N.261.46.F12]PMM82491.1 hypothetical protein BCT46_14160 [Vibrio sp. 10N.261.46.E8]